jgi:hypothetical protein
VALAVLLVLGGGGFYAVRNGGSDSATPVPPSTQPIQTRLHAMGTEPHVTSPTPSDPVGTAPADRLLHPAVTTDEFPCEVRDAAHPDPDAPSLDSFFTAPVSQPQALVPGSRSLLSYSDPDFDIEVIRNSDYVVLRWGGGPSGTEQVVGHLDPATGTFRRSFSITGCFEWFGDEMLVTADAGEHLWALSHAGDTTNLADFDLATGEVSWSATCTACMALLQSGTEVWVVANVVQLASRGSAESGYSGSGELFAIDWVSHHLREPVRFDGSVIHSDNAELWVVNNEVVSALDPSTGSVVKDLGIFKYSLVDHPVSEDLVILGGKLVWNNSATEGGVVIVYDLESFQEEARFSVPCARTRIAADRVWYLSDRCQSRADEVEIGVIDPKSGAREVVSEFKTYEAHVTHAGIVPVVPEIVMDDSGFWYREQVPTPSGGPGSVPSSSGPTHLMHVDVDVASAG